ncbi:MAG: metal-dependent hydrolase [Pseudomonadales bacterium]|jgi:predicted metal-dependent hydrolase
MTVHPMDKIPVRQMRFNFDAVDGHDPVWSQSNPDFSIFINAFGVHVPHFERFLVKVMRAYRDELEDKELFKDVQAIIGQEAHHAFNFINWTREMCRRYKGLDSLDEQARNYFDVAIRKRSKKFQIGFTAGYETFTFLGGLIILNRFQELMGKADPTIRALWVWHQVEEIEHGAVAFDFYQAFYPEDLWYRRAMVIFAFAHISWETFKAFALMVRSEGFYNRSGRALKAWCFFVSFAWDLGRSAVPVLAKTYHPRKHPICNGDQSRIAVAWRCYYEDGNDAHALSNQDIEVLLAP